MGVGSGRSSVTDLAFQVFNRSLHPDWFSTREFRRIEQTGGRPTSGSLKEGTRSSFAPARSASLKSCRAPKRHYPSPACSFDPTSTASDPPFSVRVERLNTRAALRWSGSISRSSRISAMKSRSRAPGNSSSTGSIRRTGWRHSPSVIFRSARESGTCRSRRSTPSLMNVQSSGHSPCSNSRLRARKVEVQVDSEFENGPRDW